MNRGRGDLQIQHQRLTVEQRTGPLPPAEELERYNAIVPGMAERLLTNFEQQSTHRMGLERHVIVWDVRRANLGIVFAFIFGLVMVAAAVYLITSGYEIIGVGTIIATFATYGGAFLYSSESRRRERQRKEELR